MFHPNIPSLKTAIEEEWKKMYEKFILKPCKSFRRGIDTIIKKMVAILSKSTVLCLSSYFVVYSFKLKLIVFYNGIFYHTRRFEIISLLQPARVKEVFGKLVVTYRKAWNHKNYMQ